MTIERFDHYEPRGATLTVIENAQAIIGEYRADRLTLTLRQLYYQFVARDLLPNTERSYKNLGRIITNARLGGMISWTAIEDRGRSSYRVRGEETPEAALDGIEYNLILDPWRDQENYVEVWIEKEALHGVIERPCDRFRVTHMACKGYLSASEAWRSGKRFEDAVRRGKTPVIIHLGDHDPSGIDMTRDNKDRASTFSWSTIEMHRIALNMDQIEEHRPPPNPAKVTDSRAEAYIREYGSSSWELDALDPKVLQSLVTNAINGFITDREAWDLVNTEEETSRHHLAMLADRWKDVEAFLEDLE